MEDNYEQEQEVSVEDLQKALAEKDSALNDMKHQFEAMKSKAGQLLDETKKAKARAREEAEMARAAEEEKAKKNGDYEHLLKSSEEKRKSLESELLSLRDSVSSEKTRNEAMRIASELADGPNAEILSEFVSKRIKYTDDGIKVLDSHGQLTVSTLDELKSEFANNAKYQSLLRGSKSSGGGAVGGAGSSAPQARVITRDQFEAMTPAQKLAFSKDPSSKIED